MINIKLGDVIRDNMTDIILEVLNTSFGETGIPNKIKGNDKTFKGMVTPYNRKDYRADESVSTERLRIRTLKDVSLNEKDIIVVFGKRYQIESSINYSHFNDFNSYIGRLIL